MQYEHTHPGKTLEALGSLETHMRSIILLLAAVALTGCARTSTSTSVMPLTADTVQITVEAAPVCGQTGAQQVALKTAAIETINRSYDRFVIAGGSYQDNVGVIGTTPLISNSTSTSTSTINVYQYGSRATVDTSIPFRAFQEKNVLESFYEGRRLRQQAQAMRQHQVQVLVVKMFHEDGENAENAVDARGVLGEDWQKIVKSGAPNTCK